jgi:cytochrome c oxidase subunit II
MQSKPHITTRRGFITAMGFGGVSLYGLWAAYGAAPGPLALLGLDHAGETGSGAAHGGHGAAPQGPGSEEFSRMTAEFIERYQLPDGTVYPRELDEHHVMEGMDHHAMEGMDHHAMEGMDHGAMETMDHGAMETMDHGADSHDAVADGAGHGHEGDAFDVYLSAGMWYYLPNKLRLDAGQPYRFKMMALDVSHGASIQFGKGGRMVRLRPGRVTEMEITFEKPGRYLVYCTVYCGPAHDIMQATIEVV